MTGIKEFFTGGGYWMIPIAFMLILGLAIAIERFIFLNFRYSTNANQFMAQIQKLVMANNVDRAIKLCNALPQASLPKVIKSGLKRANKGSEEIANAIEEATLEVLPNVTKRTSTLQQVANIATLLGLLGTVMGLIKAFTAVGADDGSSSSEKQAKLITAISVALNTTAFGLMVAIPLLLIYVFLNNTTKRIIDEIDQYSVKLQNLLVSRGKGTL